MQLQQFVDGDEYPVRYFEDDDRTAIVADLGVGGNASVDVVSGLALVTVDGETMEIDLPVDPERAFIRNGVLTIELEEHA